MSTYEAVIRPFLNAKHPFWCNYRQSNLVVTYFQVRQWSSINSSMLLSDLLLSLRATIFIFSGLVGRGLMVRNVLGVSPSTACGIFRSRPSGNCRHCAREEEKGAGFQRRRCCRPWSLSSTSSFLGYRCSCREEVHEGLQRRQYRRRWSSTLFSFPQTAGSTTPEDATHRWRRNVDKIYQNYTTVTKSGK